MSDFILNDNQNVTLSIALTDAANNVVTANQLDANSVTATFQDGSEFTVVVSADQSSVNVKANGILTKNDVLTVNGSLNSIQLTPGTLTFDEGTSTATVIGLTPGVPSNN